MGTRCDYHNGITQCNRGARYFYRTFDEIFSRCEYHRFGTITGDRAKYGLNWWEMTESEYLVAQVMNE
jgi:hypothetical protein